MGIGGRIGRPGVGRTGSDDIVNSIYSDSEPTRDRRSDPNPNTDTESNNTTLSSTTFRFCCPPVNLVRSDLVIQMG